MNVQLCDRHLPETAMAQWFCWVEYGGSTGGVSVCPEHLPELVGELVARCHAPGSRLVVSRLAPQPQAPDTLKWVDIGEVHAAQEAAFRAEERRREEGATAKQRGRKT